MTVALFLNSTVYAIDLSKSTSLRKPFDLIKGSNVAPRYLEVLEELSIRKFSKRKIEKFKDNLSSDDITDILKAMKDEFTLAYRDRDTFEIERLKEKYQKLLHMIEISISSSGWKDMIEINIISDNAYYLDKIINEAEKSTLSNIKFYLRVWHRIKNYRLFKSIAKYGFWVEHDINEPVFADRFYHHNHMSIPSQRKYSLDLVFDIPRELCSGTTLVALKKREGIRPDGRLFEELRGNGFSELANEMESLAMRNKLTGLTPQEVRRFLNFDEMKEDRHNNKDRLEVFDSILSLDGGDQIFSAKKSLEVSHETLFCL